MAVPLDSRLLYDLKERIDGLPYGTLNATFVLKDFDDDYVHVEVRGYESTNGNYEYRIGLADGDDLDW